MKVAGSIALVTGANRGLGLAFARALKEMGAAKVYAAARNPEAVRYPFSVPASGLSFLSTVRGFCRNGLSVTAAHS